MNAKQIKAINEEYGRLEGIARGEIRARLWDHGANRYRMARCVLIDLGRRPPVTPADLTRDDRENIALRGAVHQTRPVRSLETPETLCQRLRTWLKQVGTATHHDAAKAINVTEAQAKHLLTSNAHLFKPWKKIAGQSYYVAL